MATRNIMRIEITAAARKNLESLREKFGMTQLSIDSRLVEWAAKVDPAIRIQILHGQGKKEEIAKSIAEQMMR